MVSIDLREHLLCHNCGVIATLPQYFPDSNTETERYLNHQNNIENEGYCNFLMRVILPIQEKLKGKDCLDFGCGHTPVLSVLAEKEGAKRCYNYDPYFFPNLPEQSFDIVFCTEAAEHFFEPMLSWELMVAKTKPMGLLALMTELQPPIELFANWYYARDNTHVAFYSEKTIRFLCKHFGLKILYTDNQRVLVLQKMTLS